MFLRRRDVDKQEEGSIKYRGCFVGWQRVFKNKFEIEKYLTLLTDFKSRKTLAKFRCSDHKLLVETGRHAGLQLTERKCQMCSLDEIEDEIHFLCVCPAYEDQRNLLFQIAKPPAGVHSEEIFKNIFSNTDITVINALYKFISNHGTSSQSTTMDNPNS